MNWQPNHQDLADGKTPQERAHVSTLAPIPASVPKSENILDGKLCLTCGVQILKTRSPGNAMEFDTGYVCVDCQKQIFNSWVESGMMEGRNKP